MLPREFKEKNKSTGDEIEYPLTDTGIALGKKFTFLDLCVIKNALQNLQGVFY